MTRAHALAVLGTVTALLSGTVTSAAAPGDLVIAGHGCCATVLGPLRPRVNATSSATVRAFGRDYYRARGCRFVWRRIGLSIQMENFGGTGDPCGFAQIAYISGPNAGRWRTTRGLRIGSSFSTLRRLYPAATRHGPSWWLVRGFCCALPPYALIGARVVNGRVVQLRVWIGGAGE